MEDKTLFRSPLGELMSEEESPHSSSLVTEKTAESTDMPPSLYEEAQKVPLILELLKSESVYNQFDMPVLTRELDSYINEEVLRQGLADTRNDYQGVLDNAMEKLDIPEGLDIYTIVEKLVRYFRIQHKLYTALREKEELMAADPMELSAKKFKQYLELQHG